MRNRILVRSIAFITYMISMLSALPVFADHFPLRHDYPALKTVETGELGEIIDDVIVVDARSELEYEVIHIKGSHNILVGGMSEDDLLKLREKNGEKLIVFYCNGITCSKSYKATMKAHGFGFWNIKVYDAGIFEWATAFPEKTIFFDEPLTKENIKTMLISRNDFLKRNISTNEFFKKYRSGEYTTIDIRDINEKLENPIRLPGIKQMSLNLIKKLIKIQDGPVPKKDILFFDNVGKQIRWLQYYAEKHGLSNYYFLKGGVLQWQKEGYTPEGRKKNELHISWSGDKQVGK